MRCTKCNKLLKENTEGNPRYCQGHDVWENYESKMLRGVEEENDRQLEQLERQDLAQDEQWD